VPAATRFGSPIAPEHKAGEVCVAISTPGPSVEALLWVSWIFTRTGSLGRQVLLFRLGEPVMKSTPPVFRWAGSKRQLLHLLKDYWHAGAFERYVEPFAGSAALFFELAPPKALLNDLNSELIQAYAALRSRPNKIHKEVSAIDPTGDEYYRLRALDPKCLTPTARAIRFVFLNRFCFNGIFRANNKGQFNVPFGGDKSGGVPSVDAFKAAAAQLDKATLRVGDFGRVLSETRPGDFVYLDPPYCKPSRRPRGEYGPGAFAARDLARLRRHLVRMDERGVKFLLSYEDSLAGRKLFQEGWIKRTVRVRRNVSGFVNSRRRASELLITNVTLKSGREA